MDPEGITQVEWSRYLRWCTALADVFFSRDMAEMPAYLDLEEDASSSV